MGATSGYVLENQLGNDENRNRDWATIGVHGVDTRNICVSLAVEE